jgi:hypothetical protein
MMFVVAPGSITIMHDRPVTPNVLCEVLPTLKGKGHEIVILSEIVQYTEWLICDRTVPIQAVRSFTGQTLLIPYQIQMSTT